MPARTRSFFLHPAVFCAFALILCVLASNPILNMGMDDDWSYIWCARLLANTGHVLYNGFVEPMLGWQLYLGALFIKLFGFSFTSVRASILLVAVAGVALTQRLFVRFGVTTWNSIIATLTIALSPVFLVLSFSFMSDMAGYFSLILCLYACVRAVQTESDTAALGWLVFAALSNVLGGTARQIAWLGVLVIVPSTAWFIRRRRGALLTGAILWIVSIAIIFASMRWFSGQPYSIAGHALSSDAITLRDEASTLIRAVLAFCLILSPILIAFLVRYPLANLRARKHAAIAAALFLIATLYLVLRSKPVYWLAPFLDVHGGLLGEPPPPIPFTLRLAFTVLTFAVLIAFLLCLWNAPKLKDINPEPNPALSWKAIATLLGPFIIAYAGLLGTRYQIYERYLLPLLFVILVPVLRLYQQKITYRLPWASGLLVFFMALFGVANMHDLFAGHRARLAAVDEILASGVPRNQLRGGYEYDAWTQLESVGHMNDPRIHNPASAYHPWTPPSDVPEDCLLPFTSEVPAIVPRYRLSLSATGCFTSSQFQSVPYTNWLPPHDRTIFIQRMR
jgi:hypothetical protein